MSIGDPSRARPSVCLGYVSPDLPYETAAGYEDEKKAMKANGGGGGGD